MARFMARTGHDGYEALHRLVGRRSPTRSGGRCGTTVASSATPGERVVDPGPTMRESRFFPDAT